MVTTAANRRHGRLAIAAVSGVALLIVVGCADRQNGAAGGSDTNGSPPASSSSTLETNLTQSVSYDDGMIRFDPAPTGVAPGITASAALAAHAKTGLYANASDYSEPTTVFGLYTNFGSGTADAHGGVALSSQNQPVWIVTFTGVPDMGSGGGVVGSAGPRPSRRAEIHDIVDVVDANTGQSIVVLSDIKDAPTRMSPPTPSPVVKSS